MKSYTDLEQSKKLAEILSLESADMYIYKNVFFGALSCFNSTAQIGEYIKLTDKEDKAYPCWSLAALLDIMPKKIYRKDKIHNEMAYVPCYRREISPTSIYYTDGSNIMDYISFKYGENNKFLLDACYDMILKLHELKML